MVFEKSHVGERKKKEVSEIPARPSFKKHRNWHDMEDEINSLCNLVPCIWQFLEMTSMQT